MGTRRIHGRKYRDWTLEAVPGDAWTLGGHWLSPQLPAHYLLSISVTDEEARRLMETLTGPEGAYRGLVSFGYGAGSVLRISEIEITEAEALRITRGGEDPYEVIVPAVPACGYRLFAVDDPLLGGR